MSARMFSHRAQHFRLIEHLRSTAVGMQSPMQHMFYRYRRSNERFTRSHLCTLPQKFQGWDSANTTDSQFSARLLWPLISEALWEEAERTENIAGIEVMPDPVRAGTVTGLHKDPHGDEQRGGKGPSRWAHNHEPREYGGLAAGKWAVAAKWSCGECKYKPNKFANKCSPLLETVSQCSARFGEFRDQAEINRHRIDNVKRRHYELRHRLVRIMGIVEKLRRRRSCYRRRRYVSAAIEPFGKPTK